LSGRAYATDVIGAALLVLSGGSGHRPWAGLLRAARRRIPDMTTRTAIDTADTGSRSECWCCGCFESQGRLIHLGNHPEVTLCVRCGYWMRTRAQEVEDQSRTGVLVRFRHVMRRARNKVIQRDLHRHPVFGRPLRWLGKHLP
jgi:hypothetical protein